jgi:beta-lactam-binding protein with PASTA domain
MPALEGKSMGFALEILRRSHLVLGDTIFRPDFMRGSVLEQQFRGGKIQPGAKLPWGSVVDLIIGSGLDETPIPVPELIGLRFAEAKLMLDSSGILLGSLVLDPDVTDTASAFIWKQNPPIINDLGAKLKIQPGQLIDLWLSLEPKVESDSTSSY